MMATAGAGLSSEDAERLRSFERERHNSLAISYHNFFTPVTTLAIKPLFEAVRLRPGDHLLDVATGPGSAAAEALKSGARPVGVDLSPRMIELAKSSYPGIEFRVADVEHLPYGYGSFDAIVCNFGLGHFPRPESSVAECVRTLRPGARLALSWWDDPSRQRIQGLFREAIAEIGAAPPPEVPAGFSVLRFSDTSEFRQLLEGVGLIDVAVQDHQTTYLVPDVHTLWHGGLGSFALAGSAIAYQDSKTQAAIRASLERRAAVYQSPNGLMLPIAFKIGVGRKAIA